MNYHKLLAVTGTLILGTIPSQAGSVNELHNQDTAFALAAEAFRLVQSSLIEADYYSRLAAAQRESTRAREAISKLGEMERQLRASKLTTQVANLQVAYDFARRGDERRLGVTIPQQPDRQAVNQELRKALPAAVMDVDAPVFVTADLPGLTALNQWLHPVPSVEPAALPESCGRFVDLLKRAYGPTHPLVQAVRDTFRQDAGLEPALPTLALVTYRKCGATIRDVVIQVFHSATAEMPARTTATPKAEVFDRIDQWQTLLTQATVHWYGAASLIDERQQVFAQVLQADLTSVQRQTVEPLYIVGLLPSAHDFLPVCLQRRVTGVVATAELGQPEWQTAIQFMTLNSETAEQTAGLLESWRMMLTSLMTSGELQTGRSKPCRQVIDAVSITVNGSRVLVTGRLPALMGLHGSDRLMQWAVANAR